MHLSEETIDRYVLRRMDDADLSSVEEHLMGCERCRNQVDILYSILLGLQHELPDNGGQTSTCIRIHGATFTVRIQWVETVRPTAR